MTKTRNRTPLARALLFLFGLLLVGTAHADQGLVAGTRYRTLQPTWIMATYNDVDDRRLSKDTARAYLHSRKYADRSFVAFQVEVPPGTVMTVVDQVPTPWYHLFAADRYRVQLQPDPARGLDTVLQLDRGMDGSLDGLNAERFERAN